MKIDSSNSIEKSDEIDEMNKMNESTPQKFSHQKLPYLRKEIHLPRPIILGIQPLVFVGVHVSR